MIDFLIRDNLYPFAIWKLRRFFERSQWFTPDELRAYQERRLRQIVAQAYERVPYYRALFTRLGATPADIRTLDDLAKLPTLAKATVRAERQTLQATDCDRHHAQLVMTSGTSGDPLGVLLDKPARVLEFVYYWRHWSWAGYRLGTWFAELSSQKFLARDDVAEQTYRAEPITGRLLLNTVWLGRARVAGYVEAIRRHRPRFLKGVASTLYYFADSFRQAGIDDVRFDGVFSTGEVLAAGQRRVVEEVFRTKVYDSYGQIERTVAISECPAGNRHVNPEYGILELASPRPTGTFVGPDGIRRTILEGRVVGTALHNFSMPLLRYEVGDLVEVEDPPRSCACGRGMPLVRRINGRQGDVIVTPDGRVNTTLFVVFEEVPGIAQGQVIQEDLHHLRVRIVPSARYTEETGPELLVYLRRFVGHEVRITLECVSSDEMRAELDGKFRAIVSRLSREPAEALATST